MIRLITLQTGSQPSELCVKYQVMTCKEWKAAGFAKVTFLSRSKLNHMESHFPVSYGQKVSVYNVPVETTTTSAIDLVVLLPLQQTFPSPHSSYRPSTSSQLVKGNGFSSCVLHEVILKQVLLSEKNRLAGSTLNLVAVNWLQFLFTRMQTGPYVAMQLVGV